MNAWTKCNFKFSLSFTWGYETKQKETLEIYNKSFAGHFWALFQMTAIMHTAKTVITNLVTFSNCFFVGMLLSKKDRQEKTLSSGLSMWVHME